MTSEGSVDAARRSFLASRFRNLDFLLRSRYGWMNDYLGPDRTAVEIGAGAGFSELYLSCRPIMTDAADHPWIDRFIDATAMDLADASCDVIIASHNIHHFYSPYKFFEECVRVLRPGGVVLIQEINTSLLMRLLLRMMRHEGWNYGVDVFDEKAVVNDPHDLWSANCAVPELLFSDRSKFERTFTQLRIDRNEPCECFLFPVSGGVVSKTKVPELPAFMLGAIRSLDDVLVALAPSVFALGRRVVLRKAA